MQNATGSAGASGAGEFPASTFKECFLYSIRQIPNAAVLMKKHQDGSLEAEYVSEKFASMMECGTAEARRRMGGAGYIEAVHPDDRLRVKRMLRRRVSGDEKKELILRMLTAKGNIIWCNVQYAFIDDFQEHYIYTSYFDITEKKEYEERLHVAYMSLGDNFYQTNENTLSMFRVNLTRDRIEDIQGKDLFHTDSMMRRYSEVIKQRAGNYPVMVERERFLELFSAGKLIEGYAKGRTQFSQVLFSRRKGKRFCYVKVMADLARHPLTGELIAFISEQEHNHEKVNSILLEEILSRQFDMVAYIVNGRYGIVAGDSSLIGKGSIFPIVKNGDYEEWMENQVYPVLHGTKEEREHVQAGLLLDHVVESAKKEMPYVANIACDIDGEIFYKRFDFYSITPGAEFLVLLKSDTTKIQQKQIERNNQLAQALTEAEQANVAKTAFLSRMSHEIRTPMNAIIGLDKIALQEKGLPETAKKHLEKIGFSAEYLLTLINDILDMSRIESGRMSLKKEEFSFRDFLEQVNTLIYSQCHEKGLEYNCVIRGKAEGYYIGDSRKLKQVLVNILGNAVKFTEAPGKVSFFVENLMEYKEKSVFRFVIKDTGIGIGEDFLPHIYDPFSQEDFSNTNYFGSTGLGLAISKNMVEMMNGSISVKSKKGEGTEFSVEVPLNHSGREQMEEEESSIVLQDLRVLIVDDDPESCQHAEIVLEELGIVAESCHGGKEALELIRLQRAKRNAYHLILMDLKMPELDGLESTHRIREIAGYDSVIIVLTAYDWNGVEEEAARVGVDGFMSKPLFAEGIRQQFRHIIHQKKMKMEKEVPLADLNGRRILVAEDVDINAEILISLLEMDGMEAEHARNGQEAVQLFGMHSEGYYDAILMDINMPVMDGLTATQKIRSMNHLDSREIPIVAMTANAFDEDVERSLRAGMNAHLSKPVDPERIAATLSELIGAAEERRS